jgi:putative transposase
MYTIIGRGWHESRIDVTTFLACAPEVVRVISTTNAIESVNYSLRKVTRN